MGISSMSAGTSRGGDRRCAQRGGPHDQVADRLAHPALQLLHPDQRTHAPEHLKKPGAGRVEADAGDREFARLGQHRGADQERRRRRVSRHLEIERHDRSAGLKAKPAVLLGDRDSRTRGACRSV